MSTLRKLRRTSGTSRNRFEPILLEPLPFIRKMSEVLLEFAEPLLEAFDDDSHFRDVIAMAAFCWNLTLLQPNEREAAINDIVKQMAGRDAFKRVGVREALRVLLDRKKALFADDNRLIVNYEIVEEETGPRLLVMSSPIKDGHAEDT
ncbi:MAG: hypothetical protein ACYTEK_08820 [Planctomycetota bacterium]